VNPAARIAALNEPKCRCNVVADGQHPSSMNLSARSHMPAALAIGGFKSSAAGARPYRAANARIAARSAAARAFQRVATAQDALETLLAARRFAGKKGAGELPWS